WGGARGGALLWAGVTRDVWGRKGRSPQLAFPTAVGNRLGVPNVSWNAPLDLTDAVDWPATEIGFPARLAGRPCRVLAATQAPPSMLSGHVAALRGQGVDVVLASQLLIDAALEAHA